MVNSRMIALIPAYEPDEKLCELLQNIRDAQMFCVIVDDGSGDTYASIFKQAENYGIVLHHEKNEGKGAALKTGLSYIEKHYNENYVIVTMDSDGQHTVEDGKRIAEKAFLNPHMIVLGSREFTGNIPRKSKFGNQITRWIFRFATGCSVEDTQTGLRAFSYQMIPFLSAVPGERYEYEMNVLLACAREKIRMIEDPIETLYFEGNSGTHFHPFKDSFRIYRELLKFTASSFVGFLVDYGMYSLFSFLTAGMGAVLSLTISNLFARVISASVNFTINKKFVFKSKKDTLTAAVEYFLLAAGILIGNTIVLNILVELLGMNRFGAKILVEIIFFFVSLIVQKTVIFQERQGSVKR